MRHFYRIPPTGGGESRWNEGNWFSPNSAFRYWVLDIDLLVGLAIPPMLSCMACQRGGSREGRLERPNFKRNMRMLGSDVEAVDPAAIDSIYMAFVSFSKL